MPTTEVLGKLTDTGGDIIRHVPLKSVLVAAAAGLAVRAVHDHFEIQHILEPLALDTESLVFEKSPDDQQPDGGAVVYTAHYLN